MKRKNSDFDFPGGVLPLTEPDLKAKGDVVTKYQLAKVRYQTYYDALELLLTPQQLALVE